jgi:hypothetical protein
MKPDRFYSRLPRTAALAPAAARRTPFSFIECGSLSRTPRGLSDALRSPAAAPLLLSSILAWPLPSGHGVRLLSEAETM